MSEPVEQVRELRRQLTEAQRNNHQRNLELDALHYVWCDGGCESGTHRWQHETPLTDEIVDAAVRNTERLVRWVRNREFKTEWRQSPANVHAGFLRLAQQVRQAEAERDTLRRERELLTDELGRALSAADVYQRSGRDIALDEEHTRTRLARLEGFLREEGDDIVGAYSDAYSSVAAEKMRDAIESVLKQEADNA